jgi:hypothetical protein
MRYRHLMRITIDIDDDVLIAANELAQRQRSTAGRVLSRLAREALTGGQTLVGTLGQNVAEPPAMSGFRPFPKNGSVVTNYSINQLRDHEGV